MSLFSQFNTDKVTLVKKESGKRYKDIDAQVDPEMIFIDDSTIPIEEGDLFIRELPNGLEEKYEVLDRGFYSKTGSMDAHYQVKVKKLNKSSEQNKNGKTVYNLGDNSRVNINSEDSSINVINTESNSLFAEIKSTVKSEVENEKEKQKLLNKIEELEEAQNTSNFPKKYSEFMALAANHTAVLEPYLQALGQLLIS